MAPLTFLAWLTLVWAGGWFAWPGLRALLAPPAQDGTPRTPLLADGGVALARVAFLGVWTLLAFWAGHLGLPTRLSALLWLPLALCGLVYGWRTRSQIALTLKTGRRGLFCGEALFLLVFLAFFLLRGFWSDTSGTNGEKSMDLALISAVGRATSLPPENPYAAGTRLQSYYYFGHLQTALLTRAIGAEERWTYNLMAATLPALCFGLLFTVAAGVQGSRNRGLGLVGAVLCVGTLQPLMAWSQRWAGGERGWGLLGGLDFFATSRVIPYTINEYPWFTFNQADLHAHYFSFPLQLALLALCWGVYRGRRGLLWLAPLLLGALILTNTWDLPAYALLLLLACVTEENAPGKLPMAARLALPVVLVALALALAAPYLLNLRTAANPPRWLGQPASPAGPWLLLWGPPLVLWLGSLYLLAGDRLRRSLEVLLGAAALLWLGAYVGGGHNFAALLCIAVALCSGLLFLATRQDAAAPPYRFWVVPGLAGLLALLWSEVTWAGFLGNPSLPRVDEYIRQDTVFKFGLQTWLLWGTASVGLFCAAWRRWPPALRCLLLVPVPIMLYSSALTTSGRARGFASWQRWDAWAHLGGPEQRAAAWLRAHTAPGEAILEAVHPEGGDYTEFTRITTATGIPTVLGPRAHTFQWAPAHSGNAGLEWAETDRRKDAVQLIYGDISATERKKLLDLYGVRYVVVGTYEQMIYGPNMLARLRQSLPVAWDSGHTEEPGRVLILLNPG